MDNNVYSNVSKALRKNNHCGCYKHKWLWFNDCKKEIQDIVQSTYENL